MMPKGTVLTPEEIIEKAPAIIQAAPPKVKEQLREVLEALSNTDKRYPSHIYHHPSATMGNVKVVWFDPLGIASVTWMVQSRPNTLPKWEQGKQFKWKSTHSEEQNPALHDTFLDAMNDIHERIEKRVNKGTPVYPEYQDTSDEDEEEEEGDEEYDEDDTIF